MSAEPIGLPECQDVSIKCCGESRLPTFYFQERIQPQGLALGREQLENVDVLHLCEFQTSRKHVTAAYSYGGSPTSIAYQYNIAFLGPVSAKKEDP